MRKNTLKNEYPSAPCGKSPLSNELADFLRKSAVSLLRAAVEAECEEYLEACRKRCTPDGRPAVVRNGRAPERRVLTGLGSLPVWVPKVRSRDEKPAVFRSSLVPPYLRRTPALDTGLPYHYLLGISQRNVSTTLSALVGESQVRNVSAAAISRLKASWEEEYREWMRADLSGDDWVYLWADGIRSRLRDVGGEPLCLLVVIGVNTSGEKRFLAIEDGMRESIKSWRQILRAMRKRGLRAPRATVASDALGFHRALGELFPKTRLKPR